MSDFKAAAGPGQRPQLLPPSSYFLPAILEREKDRILGPAWHLVGTTSELRRPGDFITVELLGRSVQVRNFGGQIAAVSNVCAHRHCLLRAERRGSDDRLRCPYHGWEYGPDGRTRQIPSPKDFAPIDRNQSSLSVYRVGSCGQLVFVCLDPEAHPLESQMGPLHAICAERFGPDFAVTLSLEVDLPCNWKVLVENSLEAYHVPHVHPHTLAEDPGEERSAYELAETFTSFSTTHFASKSRVDRALHTTEKLLFRAMGRPHQGRYFHYHGYPHLLFSFTDSLSLVQAVVPLDATRCRVLVRQFGLGRDLRPGPLRVLMALWGTLGAAITRRILREDRAILPLIQKGLEASPHQGLLGYGERRIHAFQEHLLARLNGDDHGSK